MTDSSGANNGDGTQVLAIDSEVLERAMPPVNEWDIYHSVLDNIPIRVFWKDINSIYLGANRAFLDDCNINEEKQVVGNTDYDFPWTTAEAEAFIADDRQVMDSDQAKIGIIEPQTHADGTITWLRTNKVPLHDDDGKVIGILGTYENISEFKRKEAELARSEARFRALINQTYQFIGLLDLEGRILMMNDTVLGRFQIKPQEYIGDYFPSVPLWPESEKPKLEDALVRCKTGEFVRFKTYHHLPDGEIIYVDFSLKPVFGKDGTIESLLPEGRDITEQVLAEQQLKRLNEQLEQRVEQRTKQLEKTNEQLSSTQNEVSSIQTELLQSEKMASIGALVSSFTHDINTPIGIGITASSVVEERVRSVKSQLQNKTLTQSALQNELAQLEETATLLKTNLQHAAELVRGFKQVSIDQASEATRTIQLDQYLAEIVLSLKPKLRRVSAEVELDSEVGILWDTQPGLISQIMINLIINSLEHAFDGVKSPKISIRAAKQQTSIQLEYRDNGTGMSESVLKRLYEPFFTTRRNDGGSGVGMHTVYNIITDKLGGCIECESNPDQGTNFYISLPLSENTCSS